MKKIFYILLAAFALVSCQEECLDCDFEPVHAKEFTRIYFHYLAMDNNLHPNADLNINEMFSGSTKETLNGGAIFVLRDVPGKNSQIVMIYWDELEKKVQKVIAKDYGVNLDTSDPATLERAIADVDAMADAPSWALGFGSHGTGWVPALAYDRYISNLLNFEPGAAGSSLTRFLNQNLPTGSYMELDEFAAAVINSRPSGIRRYEFILMDLCYMGGIEVAYALEDAADYLILSPAEVVYKGMPYDRIVDDIFYGEAGVVEGEGGVEVPDDEGSSHGVERICEEFYEFYNTFHNADLQYATVSLVDCAKFRPLIDVMRDVVRDRQSDIEALDIEDWAEGTSSWCFDRFPQGKHITFDMRKFVEELTGGPHAAFETALSGLVPYHATTGKPLIDPGRPTIIVSEDKFCGLSTYVPVAKFNVSQGELPSLNDYYYLTDWAQAIYQ